MRPGGGVRRRSARRTGGGGPGRRRGDRERPDPPRRPATGGGHRRGVAVRGQPRGCRRPETCRGNADRRPRRGRDPREPGRDGGHRGRRGGRRGRGGPVRGGRGPGWVRPQPLPHPRHRVRGPDRGSDRALGESLRSRRLGPRPAVAPGPDDPVRAGPRKLRPADPRHRPEHGVGGCSLPPLLGHRARPHQPVHARRGRVRGLHHRRRGLRLRRVQRPEPSRRLRSRARRPGSHPGPPPDPGARDLVPRGPSRRAGALPATGTGDDPAGRLGDLRRPSRGRGLAGGGDRGGGPARARLGVCALPRSGGRGEHRPPAGGRRRDRPGPVRGLDPGPGGDQRPDGRGRALRAVPGLGARVPGGRAAGAALPRGGARIRSRWRRRCPCGARSPPSRTSS